MQTTQLTDSRCLILKGGRDDGKHLAVDVGDEILIELEEVPEDEQTHWRPQLVPAGVFVVFDDYIADGSWYKNGRRRPERLGTCAERRLILTVTDGGPEFGTIEVANAQGGHFVVTLEVSGRTQATPLTAEQLLERLCAEFAVSALRFRYQDGQIVGRWSGPGFGDRFREARAGSFASAAAGMLLTERRLSHQYRKC